MARLNLTLQVGVIWEEGEGFIVNDIGQSFPIVGYNKIFMGLNVSF